MEYIPVRIPIKIMQYPFAQLTYNPKNIEIIYKTNKEKITYICKECITTDDMEKLFAVICLSVFVEEKIENGYALVVTKCSMKNIKKLVRLNDYKAIYASIRKFLEIKMIYESEERRVSSGFIYRITWDQDKNDITIFFHKAFYTACQRGLNVNIVRYIQLSSAAKNLYCIVASYSSYTRFDEDFLLSRTQIKSARRTKSRQTLKQAFTELVNAKVIKRYIQVKKDKKYYYLIERNDTKKSYNLL